jgi:hypothetical protein
MKYILSFSCFFEENRSIAIEFVEISDFLTRVNDERCNIYTNMNIRDLNKRLIELKITEYPNSRYDMLLALKDE